MGIKFKILRFDPIRNENPYFQDFTSSPELSDSVLDALRDIRDNQDPSLSFRYSCREAVCGSCGLVINGQIALGCRTTIRSLKSELIIIEPLPNLEIKKDLIVDMTPFYQAMEAIQPFLQPRGKSPEQGHRIDEKHMEKIYQFITCLWCGCCYASCPVASRDGTYLGPAALAKLYRFLKDTRDSRPSSYWDIINNEKGIWGCDTVFRCNDVCPKEVRPADAIIRLRQKLLGDKIKNLFKKKNEA